MKFNVLDLFSGAGGFSAGLDSVKSIETVAALDFDKYATETFKKNFPKADVVTGDITKENVKSEIIKIAKKRNILFFNYGLNKGGTESYFLNLCYKGIKSGNICKRININVSQFCKSLFCRYFKIEYEEHNLVRSKCQLKLVLDV